MLSERTVREKRRNWGLPADRTELYVECWESGAGGARTHDRRIMRSTAPRIVRTACTDTTEPCRR
jgi:hypothetical protein